MSYVWGKLNQEKKNYIWENGTFRAQKKKKIKKNKKKICFYTLES